MSTKTREGLQGWEERQPHDGGLTIAKKRRTDLESDVSIEGNDLLQLIENVVAKACRGFVMPAATGSSAEAIQSLRSEMTENISRVQDQLAELLCESMTRMQAEADKRTDAMLERLVQHVHDASKQTNNGATNTATVHAMPEEATQFLRSEMREGIPHGEQAYHLDSAQTSHLSTLRTS